MNKPPKPRSALVEFFAPGPAAYDERRPHRILFFTLVIGIAVAVAVGFALYYLNGNHRF